MEREIGQEVFKRTPQGLKLTEVGDHYLQFLKKVAQNYEDFYIASALRKRTFMWVHLIQPLKSMVHPS